MSNALPSRAAAALRPARPLALASGGRLVLHPFTIRRRIMLHAVECPLWYDGERFGLVPSWCAALRILAEPDAASLSLELALSGPAAFVADSVGWVENHDPALEMDDISAAARAIKDEWSALCSLDPPERKAGQTVTKAGEVAGPGTETTPNSSATASTLGVGTTSAPSIVPSASSSSPGAANGAASTAERGSAG